VTKYASGTIMKRGQSHVPKSAAAETVSTTGTSIETGEAGSVYVVVTVTAFAGTTPTLLVIVEGSADNSTWFTIGLIGLSGFVVGSAAAAPTNIVGNGTYVGVFPAMQFMRYRSVIGGSGGPSFTYGIVFEADRPPF
jgi:hypothetical protein